MESAKKITGVLFMIAVSEFFVGMMSAEAMYPGYSISGNTISHLGSEVCTAGGCYFQQPSANIFNSSVSLLGILVILGAVIGLRDARPMAITLVITGLGAIGVGLTLALHSSSFLHSLVSLVTFLAAGVSAILTFTVQGRYISALSAALGILSLSATFLFTAGIYAWLGIGGMERLIVYPVLVWGAALGGSLASENKGLTLRRQA